MRPLIRTSCTIAMLAGAFSTAACQSDTTAPTHDSASESAEHQAGVADPSEAYAADSPEGTEATASAQEEPTSTAADAPQSVDEPGGEVATPTAVVADGDAPLVEASDADLIAAAPLIGRWRIDIAASIALAPARFADMDATAMERMQFRVRFEPDGVMAMGPTRNANGDAQHPSEGGFGNVVIDGSAMTFDTTSPLGVQAMRVVFATPDNMTLTLPDDEPAMVLVRVQAEE
ncbi:MAG: hypothetical protein ACI82G_001407 [Bradymonadia bacterium]|jgi:hypothetical protein